MTQSFVLKGTTQWPVPGGWSNSGATVQGLGAGGKGSIKSSNTVVGGGGGGGEWRKANLSGLTTGNNVATAVGDGSSATPGNTTFAATTLIAVAGGQGSTTLAGAGGTGGTGAAGNANGGAGAKLSSTIGSGGGGAGGPTGAGTTATTQGGGAANGGAVAGGTAGNAGNTSTTFDASHGCGSGGSGGAAGANAGFAGGNYGGGSGANGASSGASPTVAVGGDGLLVITYTANTSANQATTTPTKSLTTPKISARTLTAKGPIGHLTKTGSTTGTSTTTITKVGNVGDIQVVAINIVGGTTGVTAFSGWTDATSGGNAPGAHIYYRVIQSGDASTYAYTNDGTSAVWSTASYGAGGSADVIGGIGFWSGGSNWFTQQVTTTQVNDFVLVIVNQYQSGGGVINTPSGGWVKDTGSANVNNIGNAIFSKEFASIGATGDSTTVSYTPSASSFQTIQFAISAGGVPNSASLTRAVTRSKSLSSLGPPGHITKTGSATGTSASTPVSVTKVGATGDIQLLIIFQVGAISVTAGPAGFTQIAIVDPTCWVGYRVLQAGDASTFSYAHNGTSTKWATASYSGANGIDASGSLQISSVVNSWLAPTVTTTGNNSRDVILIVQQGGGTITPASGFSTDVASANGTILSQEYATPTTTGTVSGVMTGDSGSTAVVQVSLLAAGTTSPIASLTKQTGKPLAALASRVAALVANKTTVLALAAASSRVASLTTALTYARSLLAAANHATSYATNTASKASSASGSTISIAGSVGNAGDLQVACISFSTLTGAASSSSTFTLAGVSTAMGGSVQFEVWYRIRPSNGATGTITLSVGTSYNSVCMTYSVPGSATPLDVAGVVTTGNTSSISAASITPTAVATINLIAVAHNRQELINSLPSGFQNDVEQSTSSSYSNAILSRLRSDYSATGAQSVGYPNADNSAAMQLTFTLAPANASLVKQAGKVLRAVCSPLATLTALATHVLSLAASSSPIATLVNGTGKLLLAASSPLATLVNQTLKLLQALVSPLAALDTFFTAGGGGTTFNQSAQAVSTAVATLANQTSKLLQATASAVATLAKQTARLLQATATSVATLVRSAGKLLLASTTPTESIVKQTGKVLQVNPNVTWNPSDKSAGITLSGSNLTATK